MLILFFINSKKAIKNLSKENLKLKEKLKSSSFNKKKVQEKNPFNLNKRNSNSNNQEEIQNLKLQLNETKTKYKEQVGIIMEYERRMKNFIQLYKKQKNYFREYSIKNFFYYFLPILSDIDKSFHQNKIDEYLKKINNYLKELQNYQKINEKFLIKNEYIYLNFKIFEILMILLFNVYEEKAKIIQKCFLRKYLKNGIFNNIKLKIIKFYRAYKLFIINNYIKK